MFDSADNTVCFTCTDGAGDVFCMKRAYVDHSRPELPNVEWLERSADGDSLLMCQKSGPAVSIAFRYGHVRDDETPPFVEPLVAAVVFGLTGAVIAYRRFPLLALSATRKQAVHFGASVAFRGTFIGLIVVCSL